MWLYPAQQVSADVESGTWRLKGDLHALALAYLGVAWWKRDSGFAEHWLAQAVDELSMSPDSEDETSRNARISAAHTVLQLVTLLDPAMRDRIKDVIRAAEDSRSERSVVVRTQDALVQAALSDRSNPNQLEGAISDALSAGAVATAIRGLAALRNARPEQAETLFSRAVAQAASSATTDDWIPLMLLVQITPEQQPPLPPEWRDQLVAALANSLARPPASNGHRSDLCDFAAHFMGGSPATPPALLEALRTVYAGCIADGTGMDREAQADNKLIEERDPKTAEDYLAVADLCRTPLARAGLKFRAAESADRDDKDPVRALKILDNMTPEEVKSRPQAFVRARMDTAVRAALQFINKEKDLESGLNVIDRSPRDTLVHIGVGVAEKVSGDALGAVLRLIQRALRSQSPPDPNDFLRLINVYFRHRLPDAPYMLTAIVYDMDRWREKDPKQLKPNDLWYQAPWANLTPLPFVAEMYEMVDAGRLAAIAKLTHGDTLRTTLQLTFVRAWLTRYAQSKKEKAAVAAP